MLPPIVKLTDPGQKSNFVPVYLEIVRRTVLDSPSRTLPRTAGRCISREQAPEREANHKNARIVTFLAVLETEQLKAQSCVESKTVKETVLRIFVQHVLHPIIKLTDPGQKSNFVPVYREKNRRTVLDSPPGTLPRTAGRFFSRYTGKK